MQVRVFGCIGWSRGGVGCASEAQGGGEQGCRGLLHSLRYSLFHRVGDMWYATRGEQYIMSHFNNHRHIDFDKETVCG
jgi:hypothetical protein